MRHMRALWAAAILHLHLYARHPLRLFQVILLPLCVALLLTHMPRLRGLAVEIPRAIVGAGIVGMWSALLGTASFSILRERVFYGTFALVSASPTPLVVVFAGFLLGELLIGLAAFLVAFTAVVILSGDLDFWTIPRVFLPSLVIGGAGLVSSCLVVAGVMAASPVMTRWYNALEYPTWILGGFLFPVAILPQWIQHLASAFCPYWVALALRESLAGAHAETLVPVWERILALTVIQAGAASVLFNWVGRYHRTTGELMQD